MNGFILTKLLKSYYGGCYFPSEDNNDDLHTFHKAATSYFKWIGQYLPEGSMLRNQNILLQRFTHNLIPNNRNLRLS